jgi:hypothetical protein
LPQPLCRLWRAGGPRPDGLHGHDVTRQYLNQPLVQRLAQQLQQHEQQLLVRQCRVLERKLEQLGEFQQQQLFELVLKRFVKLKLELVQL